MNKVTPLIMTILLSVSLISDGYSQDNTEERELMTVDGKVAKVDISLSTITVKTTNTLTFLVPIHTPIMNDIYDIKLSDIEPGDDVTIEHYEDPSGKLIATKVMVENEEIYQKRSLR
jgi:multidrug resistance efflux pump